MYSLLVFFLIFFSWVPPLFLRKKAHHSLSPGTIVNALLLDIYLALATLAVAIGKITTPALIVILFSIIIRLIVFFIFKNHYKDKENFYSNSKSLFLFTSLLDLISYTFMLAMLPSLSKIILILLCGIICAWIIDKNRHENQIDSTFAFSRRLNHLVDLFMSIFFPKKAILIDNRYIPIATFPFYVFLCTLFVEYILISYGYSLNLILLLAVSILAGSYFYWLFTEKKKVALIGFSFFGGFFAGAIATLAYLYFNNELGLANLNVFALAFAVAHAIGRIGCIGHGCCSGYRVTTYQPYCIHYQDPQQKVNKLYGVVTCACFPTVVIEAIVQMAIALACSLWLPYATSIWFISYGSVRMLTQTIRRIPEELDKTLACSLLLVIGILITCLL